MLRRVVLVVVMSLAFGTPAAAQHEVSRLFQLESEPRPALLLFLVDWAAADAGLWPRFAPGIRERDGWRDTVGPEDARIWSGAVEAFSGTPQRSLLFDDGMIALREWAAGALERNAVPESDRGLIEAVEAALPVYRRHWWDAHDRQSRAWIDSVAPLLAEVEDEMARRLAAAYGGHWPDEVIPVDVVPYANPVGAYSTAGRITIAAGDPGNRMPQGLELVFHEASHVDSLEGPLRDAVDAAFREQGSQAPDRFWHDVIFFTAGDAVRITMDGRGDPGYRHYGEDGVYTRGERWATQLPAFERYWRPFLESTRDSEEDRRAALRALVGALVRP